MERQPKRFSKYDDLGAYHWAWCERRSRSYEPTAEARYAVLAKRIAGARRVLDIGCGDGYLTNVASQRCKMVIGVDTERTGVRIGATLLDDHANCSLALASCYDLPFADGSFDAIVLADVIEHLESPARCLAETRRVLAGDGRFLVTTPKWRPGKMWDSERHWKEYKPGELVALLEQYYAQVTLSFFLSAAWWQVRRRLGKASLRAFARHIYNPFMREGSEPDKFNHILAVCERPRN